MSTRPVSTPSFGQADLSNCEREQIHLAASIQPHGAILVLRELDLAIVQVSANAAEFLDLGIEPLGLRVDAIDAALADKVRAALLEPIHNLPEAFRCNLTRGGLPFDCLVHRSPEGGVVLELERSGAAIDVSKDVERALQTILSTATLRSLCDETARIFKEITGYDRVMVYRFDHDGHGEVFSEQHEKSLEAFLGNRYPASDIPQIARRLYERNRVRVLVDVEYQPVPLTPRLSPLSGQDLDMSLCGLRSMSPIHIQYLKNMGVGATLVASLMVGGRLWGLISCHHYCPRLVQFEIRAACELLAETVATRIAALDSFVRAQAELSVRRLEQRMVEAISREGDWRGALFDNSLSLLQPVGASGAALLFEGQILTAGEVPGTQELREIGKWLDENGASSIFTTASLGSDHPPFEQLTQVASGILSVPVSRTPGEYLIWFRPERIRTIIWGGDPFKPVVIGENPADLSPRRSFSQWHQLMEGNAEPWTEADLAAARMIGDTISDVILQFRSVRMLIAQDQLDNVRLQVRLSELPVIIADPDGRVLLSNEAFEALLQSGHSLIQWLEDLPPLFVDPRDMGQRLQELLDQRRSWRGELSIKTRSGETRSLLIRADPVFAALGRVLGFVLLFTDLTEEKAAASARRRFQEEIIRGQRVAASRIGTTGDLVYKNLLSSIVENAQLAALEITDRVDMARMPEMLDSIRASVDRSAEIVEHLMRHARRDGNH